jgi:hypothetical protein
MSFMQDADENEDEDEDGVFLHVYVSLLFVSPYILTIDINGSELLFATPGNSLSRHPYLYQRLPPHARHLYPALLIYRCATALGAGPAHDVGGRYGPRLDAREEECAVGLGSEMR